MLRVYKAIHKETPRTARNDKTLISQICSYAVMNNLMVRIRFEMTRVKHQARPIYALATTELEDFRVLRVRGDEADQGPLRVSAHHASNTHRTVRDQNRVARYGSR